MTRRALFIGRFQPFHLGHLSVVQSIINDYDEVIIAIGSAEILREDRNPFIAKERFEMILNTLKQENLPLEKIHIVPIQDINDDQKWVSYVQSMLPAFEVVYTGSEDTKRFFVKENITVKDVEKKYDICATQIRALMKNGGDWEKYLPTGSVRICQKFLDFFK